MVRHAVALPVFLALGAGACGTDGDDRSLNAAWTFASGDCASNGIETIRVTFGPTGGAKQEATFPCSAGGGKLGTLPEGGGSYTVTAVGLDAGGVARVESYGTTVMFGGGGIGGRPVEITLRPKAADVIVSWSIGGRPCPGTTVLPFFITLHQPPAMPGGAPGTKVTEVQESCSKGQATLTRVAPGDYVVVLDSRAVTPAVKLTGQITVKAGENAQISLRS